MADPRNFAKIDLGYFDNPKITSLLDDHPRVPLLHLRAILYCRQHLTDGVFPIKPVVRMASASYCGSQCEPHSESQCDFCKAVDADLFAVRDVRNALVHDYLEHQESAAQAAKRKTAGQVAAASRWGAGKDADRNADGNADRIATGNANRNAEKRREEKSSNPHEFEVWWKVYPRKKDKVAAAKAFKKALKAAPVADLVAAVEAQTPTLMKNGIEFCPYPATWLNGERWNDEADTQPASASESNSFFDRPFKVVTNE